MVPLSGIKPSNFWILCQASNRIEFMVPLSGIKPFEFMVPLSGIKPYRIYGSSVRHITVSNLWFLCQAYKPYRIYGSSVKHKTISNFWFLCQAYNHIEFLVPLSDIKPYCVNVLVYRLYVRTTQSST